eukprot:7111778-Karenia_brevis.AAC.1
MIQEALSKGFLLPGAASKLAGRLSWASGHMFNRLGRATLRPIYDQASRRDGVICKELQHSLHWWKKILSDGITECREWVKPQGGTAHLFCDASGVEVGLGAVLFIDGN